MDAFYLIKNSRDEHMYDIVTRNSDGSLVVWGMVHYDFLSDSGIDLFTMEQPDSPIKMSRDETMRYVVTLESPND